MVHLWTVDAFTSVPFSGNPAAVCVLNEYDAVLCQKIAAEMNLSETAFLVPVHGESGKYKIRWWTPEVEVDFCGHATLASTHILYEKGLVPNNQTIQFITKSSGVFTASQPDLSKSEYLMDFPEIHPSSYSGDVDSMMKILNMKKSKFIKKIQNIVEAGPDLLIELDNVKLIEKCKPNMEEIRNQLKYRCVIITAKVTDYYGKGKSHDFKSRVFCPSCGVNEDPVTGSAHSALGVYWSKKFDKGNEWMKAYQCSKRGGEIKVKYDSGKDRIMIIGEAVTVSDVEMSIKPRSML